MARYSKAHNRASQKYQKGHYYRFSTAFPKELEDRIRERGEMFGSVNSYLVNLVMEDLGEFNEDTENIPFEDAP